MRRVVSLVVPGLMMAILAAGADSAGCGVSKGLYDVWLALGKHVPTRLSRSDSLVPGASAVTPDPDKRHAIDVEYQAFFRCLSDTAEHKDKEAVQGYCRQVEGDRLASLVCRTALYLKSGRIDAREFVDALPLGKKGAELIWDLEQIAGPPEHQQGGATLFQPGGPAYKLIDELFLLVLDDRESAAAKYFNIAENAPVEGSRHVNDQIKMLLRESPSVVVKKWVVLRQYQPKLKKVLADMTASLPKAELQKMRQGLNAFCSKDNPDCPEIVKLFGRPD
jgi:hypothetical protein